jgi:superfamily II DNA or RNA helicase
MIEYFSLNNHNFDTLMKVAMPIGPGDDAPLEEAPIPQNPAPQPPAMNAPPAAPQQPPQQQNPQPQAPQQPQQHGARQLQFIEQKAWGKWTTVIVAMELSAQERTALEKLASDYIEAAKDPATGAYPPWATWKNKWKGTDAEKKAGGRVEKAAFKLFSGVKERPGCYAIATAEPAFYQQALKVLGQSGFDVAPIQALGDAAAAAAAQQPQEAAEAPQAAQQAQNGNKIQVTMPEWNYFKLKFKRDNTVVDYIKQQRMGGRWSPNDFAWDFENVLPSKLKELAQFMKQRGFNTEEFEGLIDAYDKTLDQKKANNEDPNRIIQAEDVSDQTRFLMAIRMPRIPELRTEITEFVKFSFPSVGHLTNDMKPPFAAQPQQGQLPGIGQPPAEAPAGADPADPQAAAAPRVRPKPEGMRLEAQGKHYLYGNFDDFVRFGNLLKNSKWNVDGYRRVLGRLLAGKKLERQRFSGELDGYPAMGEDGKQLRDKSGSQLFNTDAFYQDVDQTIAGGQLLPKQKQGVAWLYSRNSAILGDKAGTGKTAESIAACAMRLKQSGGRALVFVLKNTKEQWGEEINQWLANNPEDTVSDDPASDSRWVIISYSSISAIPQRGPDGKPQFLPNGAPVLAPKKKKAQELVNKLFDAKFTCMVLDEAHVLKNEASGMSRIISHLAPKIPFKWGVTATPAANTGMDIHNLLALTGHTLGELSSKAFNDAFVGGKMNLKSMGDKDIIALQEKGAYNLRKWLTLSGAYLSRSMRAMNENLPPHEIGELPIPEADFDMQAFAVQLQNKLNAYKNPAAAICGMTAARMTLATMKVPYTVQEAKNILDQGKRVLIFSCFRNTCHAIANQLKAHLAQVDPEAQVVHIMDGDDSDSIRASIQSFKDPFSPARAMVIASLKGGTGVSLPNTTQDVLMNDFDWTPRITEQTEGRAYRINNVMPVLTRYTVIKGKNTPDELFYNYVRTKIRLSGIIQDLDSESEEYLLKGLDDTQVQAQINEAREQDRQANVDLVHDLDDMMRPFGVNILGEAQADMVGGNLDLDAEYEAQQLKDDEPGNPPVQASGWYRQVK